MDQTVKKFIERVIMQSQRALDDYGRLEQQNILWNGTPNFDSLITQETINSVPALLAVNMTVQQLADAIYALDQIRGHISDGLVALTLLANLPSNL